MSTDIEKAEFHLEADEYEKAEEIFSEIFDSDSNSNQAIKGLVICKVARSNFDDSKIKAASVYFDKLDESKLSVEEKEEFISSLLDQVEKYFKKLNKKFREEANELTKRPALDGQLYAVKELSDTTDYMDFLNKNVDKFEEGIELASKSYDLTKYKEDTAFKIVSLHDLFFKSIKETPQMTGKTLLDSKELSDLKESRKKWLDLSGENKSKVTADPSDSSGCLVLIFALSGLVGSVFLALFTLL
ncbi:hypothetical protein [Fodinibius sp. Rm-B-1B1-1]|uniref:hypothetical protein n=1 Tax=Fodinibius alkaliphilus TaxID=3140241 RepID=UPI00315A4817